MKLADALVTTLRDWDLGYIFGVGGANIEHMYDAVHRLGQSSHLAPRDETPPLAEREGYLDRLGQSRLQVVCAKSEIGAAFMADSRARVHRTLGVCCATSGGGMMNLAVGIAESYAESVPVLALVGQPSTQHHGRGAFQDSSGIGRSVNADTLWSAITKYRATIQDPRQFWPCLDAAVRAAMSGRQGPAALMIPRDMFECEVGERPAWLPESLEDYRSLCDVPASEVTELFDAICAANSPVLLLGSGVDRCSNPNAVLNFAKRLNLPVATTLSSKNSFPNGDPLYLGMVGMAGEPSVHRYLEEQADLIVAVGTGLNMMTCQPIARALKPERLAVVNIDLGEVLRIVTPAIAIEADAGVVFSKLIELFVGWDQRACERRPTIGCLKSEISDFKSQMVGRRGLGAAGATLHAKGDYGPVTKYVPRLAPELPVEEFERPRSRPRGNLLQSEALEVLQRFLPTAGHLAFDAGNCAAAALHYLRIPSGVSTTVALGMGGMGYAIAGAIGAQLGSPADARTMVICGDGAFLMLGTEVNTAVHYNLPILFVVFNNGMHGMCVTRQQLYFEGRIEGSRYPAVSIADMARGLGSPDRLWVGSAHTGEELTKRLWEYRALADGPGVLELRLAQEEIPPFTPFLTSDAPTYIAAPFVSALS